MRLNASFPNSSSVRHAQRMELGFGRLDYIREKEREQNGAGLWPLRLYQRERERESRMELAFGRLDYIREKEREQYGAGLWPLRSYQRERERAEWSWVLTAYIISERERAEWSWVLAA